MIKTFVVKASFCTGWALLCLAPLCCAGGLIVDGGFDRLSNATPVQLINTVNSTAIGGWRLFTIGAPGRAVDFEVVADEARHARALKMAMVYNPSASVDGRIGFDLYDHLLNVTVGSPLRLKFRAKLADPTRCGVMVTLAGYDAAGTVVAQQVKVFDPTKESQPYEFAPWSVPGGATHVNVVFNLVETGQQTQPREPCGVIVGGIELEPAGK